MELHRLALLIYQKKFFGAVVSKTSLLAVSETKVAFKKSIYVIYHCKPEICSKTDTVLYNVVPNDLLYIGRSHSLAQLFIGAEAVNFGFRNSKLKKKTP